MPTPRLIRPAIILAGLLLPSLPSSAADWPGWLGPNGDGSSPESGIFAPGKAELKIRWKRPLGLGYSGISLVDGTAVTLFANEGSDWLLAIRADTGEEIWRYRIDETFPQVGGADGGQNGTPVIRDGVVYGLGNRGQLFAVNLSDGSEIWSDRIDEEMGAKQPYFGFSTTPLVVGDLLFLQTGGAEGNSLSGLDRKTGKRLWSIGDDPVGYQSPVLATLGGKEQIVAVTNKRVLGLEPDGTVLWEREHGLVDRQNGWSTPILTGKDSFVLTGGAESAAFRVTRAGDAFTVETVWRAGTLKGNFAMPVVHEGHLYGYDGDFLACVDAATGERRWKARSEVTGLILVDGRLVVFDRDGSLIVAKATPDGYEETGRIQAAESGAYTYPVFSDGSIYVRNLKTMARVEVRRAGR